VTSSNPMLRQTSVTLERAGKKQKAPIWDVASKMLSNPAINRVEVNLGRISRVAKGDHPVFVPGKVLGTGVIDKKVVIGAFSFSSSAKSKIEASGGSALSVQEFLRKFPKGTGVKLVQ
jgi:large subunit ribosomal protein L18e